MRGIATARHARRVGAAARWMVVLAAIGGCGDDGGAPPAAPVAPKPTAAASPTSASGKTANKLPEKFHIEDRVACPIPPRPSDPSNGKCDPKAPACPEHLYCLPLAQGTFCEPCPERDAIRHVFKERDFAVEQNRDPFQSFLFTPLLRGSDSVPIDPTKKCLRDDQMVATSYSYSELKLVGIVAQGTQRKVLMMGGPLGYIVKRGDCVGKEKAVVKDIGTGYVTFLVDQETASANQRPPEEYSVQLNPKQLTVSEQPELSAPPRTTISPTTPAPAVVPPRPGVGSGAPVPGAGSAAAGTGSTGSAAAGAAGAGSAAPGPDVPVGTGSLAPRPAAVPAPKKP